MECNLRSVSTILHFHAASTDFSPGGGMKTLRRDEIAEHLREYSPKPEFQEGTPRLFIHHKLSQNAIIQQSKIAPLLCATILP
mmetsp:Transcript_5195/g.10995  ORF Transcript_5195/g.10995 Transcript_5195/m.10995 type:complete len:83 (-) Transcript_5195:664-912(-)